MGASTDPTLARVLDAREFRFVEEYVCGGARERGNAYRAARAAGYAHTTAETYSAMWVRAGSKKDQKPWVYEAILERRAELASKEGITPEWILEQLAILGKGARFNKITAEGDPYIDLSDASYDELTTIKSTSVDEYMEGRGEDARLVKRIKVETYDRLAAIKELMKVHGMGQTSKVVHSNDPTNPMPGQVHYDITRLTPDEQDTLIALLTKATPPPVVEGAQKALSAPAQAEAE
jgi:phage terminase small subunit